MPGGTHEGLAAAHGAASPREVSVVVWHRKGSEGLGQNLWAESPPGQPSSSSSPSSNDAGRARAKLPWGWESLGDDSSAICSVDLWVYESRSYSRCPIESVCAHNEVGFPVFITTVTEVRLALQLALTFLNANIPGNQWFWEDPPLQSWIVANFRSDTQLPKIFLQKILVSKHLTDCKFPSNRISETLEQPYD